MWLILVLILTIVNSRTYLIETEDENNLQDVAGVTNSHEEGDYVFVDPCSEQAGRGKLFEYRTHGLTLNKAGDYADPCSKSKEDRKMWWSGIR